jgi:hypothetical protein
MDLKVKIKIDDTPTYFTLDQTEQGLLKSFTLKQELDSDISKLIAPISSNELKLTCVNFQGIFNASNTSSPLYQKLKDGTELLVYDGNVRIGTFYIIDYDAPTSSISSTCSIRAVDRLQNILNTNVEVEQIYSNMSMKAYLTQVFEKVGFISEDIVIDDDLYNLTLNYTLINGKKLGELLADCMIAADCYCYISRTNKVIVKSRSISGVAVKHFTGGNINSVNIPKSLLNQSNTLKVGYVTTSKSEVEKLVELSGVSVGVGTTVLEDYKTEENNIYEIDNVKISSTSGVKIEEISATQATISMSLSSIIEETVDIVVYGKTVKKTEAFVKQQDYMRVYTEGEKGVEVKSVLLQDKDLANSLLSKLWTRLQAEIPYLTISTKTTSLEYDLCYIVDVIEPIRTKLNYLGYIHSLTYKWNGGNSVSVDLGIKGV